MTKLTLTATPSEEVVAKAAATAQVKDSRGRTITLRRPGVLAQFDLIEALGETSKNEVYLAMTLPLIYVAEIDGIAITALVNKPQVRALIQHLGEEGVNTVMVAVRENFGGANGDGEKAAIKK
jgi:hypothetical protein